MTNTKFIDWEYGNLLIESCTSTHMNVYPRKWIYLRNLSYMYELNNSTDTDISGMVASFGLKEHCKNTFSVIYLEWMDLVFIFYYFIRIIVCKIAKHTATAHCDVSILIDSIHKYRHHCHHHRCSLCVSTILCLLVVVDTSTQ